MSVNDGSGFANRSEGAGEDARGGGAKCLGMGLVGVGVTVLVVIALAGGVVAWIVLGHHDGGKTTTLSPPLSPTTTTMTSTSSHELTGGPHCHRHDGDDCLECDDGYELFDTNRCFYKCHTDLVFDVVKGEQKGLTVDDTTLHWCAANMPAHFPNTNTPVSGLRMFKAWQGNWNEAWLDRRDRWRDVARYLHHTGAKVLVGTQVTCDPEADDRDWEDVKEMMQIFGPEHIMGLAVGNELELLFQKEDVQPHWVECMTMIWEPAKDNYFLRVFHNRVHEMDSLGSEYGEIPVTSVFGGAIFADWPFMHRPVVTTDPAPGEARPMTGNVLEFCNNVTIDFGRRWVWTLNVYPYFDQGAYFDPDGSCHGEITRATCFDPPGGDPNNCEFTRLVALMRDRMAVDNFNAAGAREGTLWIGETGWSFPKADTLSTPMQWCDEFSSEEVFQRYYKAFLEWDLEMTGNYVGQGPDYVFWFTMRDSSNFAMQEHFGLIGNGDPMQWCENTTCKLQDRHFFDITTTTPYTGPPTTTSTMISTNAGSTSAGSTKSAVTTSAGTTSAAASSAGTSSAATSSAASATTPPRTTASPASPSTTTPSGSMFV